MWYWHSPFKLTALDRSALSELGVRTLYVRGGTFTNCLGKWKLDHDRTVDDETPRANVVELQLLRPNDRYFRKFALTEVDEHVRLWNYYGDPDAKEYIEYERPGASDKPAGLY